MLFQKQLFLAQTQVLTEMVRLMVTMEFKSQIDTLISGDAYQLKIPLVTSQRKMSLRPGWTSLIESFGY